MAIDLDNNGNNGTNGTGLQLWENSYQVWSLELEVEYAQ